MLSGESVVWRLQIVAASDICVIDGGGGGDHCLHHSTDTSTRPLRPPPPHRVTIATTRWAMLCWLAANCWWVWGVFLFVLCCWAWHQLGQARCPVCCSRTRASRSDYVALTLYFNAPTIVINAKLHVYFLICRRSLWWIVIVCQIDRFICWCCKVRCSIHTP